MTLSNPKKQLAMVRSPLRLRSQLRSHPVAENFRINRQVLSPHSINRLVHHYHSASAELYPACLLERILGSGKGVVGWTFVEQIAEFGMVVVVWIAVAAAAAEGLLVVVVVVDQTVALAVAAVVAVDRSEVAVVAVE